MIQKKVCMIGTYGAGTTSLMHRFVKGLFDERYHTRGGRDLTPAPRDLAGEDDVAQVRESHAQGAAAYVPVADGCRKTTLVAAEALQRKIGVVNKADLFERWQIGSGDRVEELFQALSGELENRNERIAGAR